MAHTVAITNQKGGVGKTTTAVNLAAAIAIAGRRTLLVDADPQGNTTSGVGIAKLELQLSLYDALVEDHPVQDVILQVPGLPHLSVLPATQDLVGAELQLVERPFREAALRRVLEPLERQYDYIVVDCPPSLGLLTLNVLAAVQALIIPIQCEYYGLEGISQLLNTVRLVQQNINPGLAIGGVLLTMYDSRLNLCRQVAEDATEYFGPKVFGTPIPRNVRLAEAPSFGKPILLYDMHSVGAKSYLAVAQELLRRVEGLEVTIAPAQVAAVAHANGSQPVAASAPAPEASASVQEEHAGYETGKGTGAVGGEPPEVASALQADEVAPVTTESLASESPAAESPAAESAAAESAAAEFQPTEFRATESRDSDFPEGESQVAELQATEAHGSDQGADPRVTDAAQARASHDQVVEAHSREARAGAGQTPEGQTARARAADGQVAEAQPAEAPAADESSRLEYPAADQESAEAVEPQVETAAPDEPAIVSASHASTDATPPTEAEAAASDEAKRSSPVLPDA